MPSWMIWMVVFTASARLSNAQVAAMMASGKG
jgi:hypothetical protein